jgi:hypothetical protein
MASVTFTVTVSDEDAAWQLAQFCKRSTYSDFYDHTEAHLDPEERKRRAYQMIHGIDAVTAGLREAGFSPR